MIDDETEKVSTWFDEQKELIDALDDEQQRKEGLIEITMSRDATLRELKSRFAIASEELRQTISLLKVTQKASHADFVAWGKSEENSFYGWAVKLR